MLKRIALFVLATSFGVLHAQAFRLANPIQASPAANGWTVDPGLGGLRISLPIGCVPGEIPIPVAMTLGGTLQAPHCWRENLSCGTANFLGCFKPIFGTCGFGYIGRTCGVQAAERYVALEDGRTLVSPSLANKIMVANISLGQTVLVMVRISPGKFKMGSVYGEENESPVHNVSITRYFWMGMFPVTQTQYKEIMGENPSNWKEPDAPVEQVRLIDVQEFIMKLNARQDRFLFRLPTEAEWEYACRAGTSDERYGPLNKIAWYGHAFWGRTHPVGQKEPNAFGLFDMLGNVSEWCQDWFGPYSPGDQTDPLGPPSGEGYVARSGGYCDSAYACRAAWRGGAYQPRYSHQSLGFRVVAVEKNK